MSVSRPAVLPACFDLISENLLQRLGDSLEQDAGALRRLWQSYGVSGRSRAYMQ